MVWDDPATTHEAQARADPVWHLERLINDGLDRERLDRAALEKHFVQLRIPEDRRAFLALLLWGKEF